MWLSRHSGCRIFELAVPLLSRSRRFLSCKILSRILVSARDKKARRWLEQAGGGELIRKVAAAIEERKLPARDFLFLSTGSAAAPYSLALARNFGAFAATVMTPSVLGTEPFDFAIVPEHDNPSPAENIHVTLGAPNAIDRQQLAVEADKLFQDYPPASAIRWGVLIGGDDGNYRITGDWIRKRIGTLAREAQNCKADLYVTTSRRTSPEAESALLELTDEVKVFRLLLLASKNPVNPVPGILGGCSDVFCTEDSVSMVSEAATAGFVVRLMRVERKKGLKNLFQEWIFLLVNNLGLRSSFLCGAHRFDAMLSGFKKRGLIVEEGTSPTVRGNASGEMKAVFNEADEAARWILGKWRSLPG